MSDSQSFQLTAVCEIVPCGIFAIDAEGRIVAWNRSAEQITGRTQDEVLGRNLCEVFGGMCMTTSSPVNSLDDLRKHREVRDFECTLRRDDGQIVTVLKNVKAMFGPEGEFLGAIGSLTDISYLRQVEHRLRLIQEDVARRFSFGNIIGKSPVMQEVYRLIEHAADSNATVLIEGESGTGKELVAHAIHYNSVRRNGPFVRVNCSALSEHLMESELFGHVRGAFTGAIKDKIGRFEAANGGSIFLDEVGEFGPALQVKLLRVLQEREIERVGDHRSIPVDVRIIAATNQNLRKLMEEGTFRRDLYYRLRVFPIRLPALRERREDIPLLVDYFVGKFNASTGKQIVGVAPEAMKLLMDYDWPGNVRELENAIEHAFVLCNEGTIQPFHLPEEILRVNLRPTTLPPQPLEQEPRPKNRRDAILDALHKTHWHKGNAAKLLGVSRVTLWKWMKKYGLNENTTIAQNEPKP